MKMLKLRHSTKKFLYRTLIVPSKGRQAMEGYIGALGVLNHLHDHPLRRQRTQRSASAKDRTGDWLKLLGIDVNETIQKVRFIHVAGTKGKGTTCLYCERILSEYQRTMGIPKKIGCLTSPHISDVRERIRLNSTSISKDLFSKYVWSLWKEMQYHCAREDLEPDVHVPSVPGYPGFLSLLAMYIFIQEEVDIAVIETGIGGERDSTNFILHPSATGITTLGLDHVNILGHDIGSIAWHKAGIFKPDSPAFTVEQDESALKVLRQRSIEKQVAGKLRIVTEEIVDSYGITVDPDMPYQKRNASLAIVLVEACLKELDQTFTMTPEIARSVERTALPGRCEIIVRKNNTWLINTAHNEMSVEQASVWFRRMIELPEHANAPRVLIFNHESERDSKTILELVYKNICADGAFPFQGAVFCSNVTGFGEEGLDLFDFRRDPIPSLETQNDHAARWKELGGCPSITIVHTVKDAVDFVKGNYNGARVIVAGSLYLAGAVRFTLGAEESH